MLSIEQPVKAQVSTVFISESAANSIDFKNKAF